MNELIKKKAMVFMDKKVPAHINIKGADDSKNKFYNGVITEVEEDYIILKDRMLGELPLFIEQIFNIEPQETDNKMKELGKKVVL